MTTNWEKTDHSVLYVLAANCPFVYLVITHFVFEESVLVLIVCVPVHCFIFTFHMT